MEGGVPPKRGKYLIEDIYRDLSPDALQQLSDYHSQVNPLNLSLQSVRGFLGTGAMVIVERKELTAAAPNFDFTNIPQQFQHLRLIFYGRSTLAGNAWENVGMRFNNDAGAKYNDQYVAASDTSLFADGQVTQTSILLASVPAATAPAGYFGVKEVLIPFYTSANRKSAVIHGYHLFGTLAGDQTAAVQGGAWNDTPAISRITILPTGGGTFAAGSVVTLYVHN
jgi:hypothetical protein